MMMALRSRLLCGLALLSLLITSAPADAQVNASSGGGSGGGSGTNSVPAVAESSAYTVTPSDLGKLFEVTGTNTQTLPGFSGGSAVASGFNVGFVNVGSGTVTVSASSGNITSGGSSGPTVTLSPGQTMVFVVNAAVNGWDGTTGATGAAGATGPAAVVGPGATSPNIWYVPFGMAASTSGGSTAVNSSNMYCTSGWVNNISASGGGSGTLSALAARVTTVGTSNIQLAVYANDATVTPYRPGTLIASTGNIVNTAVASVSGTVSASLAGGALYWWCLETNDASLRFLSKSAAPTDLSTLSLVGSATLANALTTSGVIGGVSVASTFGTWPSSLHGSTWTEITQQAPLLAYSFASIP